MKELTPETAWKYFEPDFERGLLIWKPRDLVEFSSSSHGKTWLTKFCGKSAGSMDTSGYIQVAFGKTAFRRSRILWAMKHGEWPLIIDHINGIKTDDRLQNLRNVGPAENSRNRWLQANNKTGYNGVRLCKMSGRYISQITVDKELINLGRYKTARAAAAVREAAQLLAVLSGCSFTPRHGAIKRAA